MSSLGEYLCNIQKTKRSGLPTTASGVFRYKVQREEVASFILKCKRVCVCTSVANRLPTLMESDAMRRMWVVLCEEASGMKEGELMMPIFKYNPVRAVLIGDP